MRILLSRKRKDIETLLIVLLVVSCLVVAVGDTLVTAKIKQLLAIQDFFQLAQRRNAVIEPGGGYSLSYSIRISDLRRSWSGQLRS
jgi:hypothetical protein